MKFLLFFTLFLLSLNANSVVINQDTVLDIVKSRKIAVSRIPYTYLGSRDIFLSQAEKVLASGNHSERMTYFYRIVYGGTNHNIAFDISSSQCVMTRLSTAEESLIARLSEERMDCIKKMMMAPEPNDAVQKELDSCVAKVDKKGESIKAPKIEYIKKEVCEELYGTKL